MNTAPSVSSALILFFFVHVEILIKQQLLPSFLSADNGSTLSSEAITDSATSTDNNYGYMGTQNMNKHTCVLCDPSPQAVSLVGPWVSSSQQLCSLTHFLHVFVHQDQSFSNGAQSSKTFTT